jgi:hypothetical protein
VRPGPSLTPAATVFVVTLRAVAGPDNAEPDGRRYDILAFARADDDDAAMHVAFHGLAQLGWIDAEALRAGEIVDPEAIPPDMQGAYQRALTGGCAVIVYDEP